MVFNSKQVGNNEDAISFQLYLKFEDDSMEKLVAKNVFILKLLKDEREKMSQYIKSNKLYAENFDDLLKIIEYYDKLKEKN